LGGARTGKSAFAQALAAQLGGRVTFMATAEAGDEEMRARIDRHQRSRPDHWRTVEVPLRVGEALQTECQRADVVVIDCLTLLIANLMGEIGDDTEAGGTRAEAEMDRIIRAHGSGNATLIVVSNEVGMGVVPAFASGRAYRDLLGRANQRLAQSADRVYWLLAGLPIEVKASGLAASWEGAHGLG
jgi:adenosylcobinamide kinase/adenosylcobinamide-phosphate guanylyltransferase